MNSIVSPTGLPEARGPSRPRLDHKMDKGTRAIFALLIAAIVWNLGTWALCLPASSSHTLIGSIMAAFIGCSPRSSDSRSSRT